ncbi:MAG: phosphatidylglycerophosphatase A [Candidatus Omnitrophica bacterium]|nr:phosphatidylglycerophosphatase A [Candidatus Omnitrophota bacterium]
MKKTRKAVYAVATVFGLGMSRVAPGTWGTLAGLPVCLALHGHAAVYVLVFLCLFAAGVVSAGRVESEEGVKDPPFVIIDEFAGVFPVFFLIPLTPLYVIVGFCVYRLLDIIKVPPMRKLEDIQGGWGIMLDDLAAGIYANLLLRLLLFLTART